MPNESLIHADVFFFISTIALVLISIGIVVALVYAIKILRNVRDVTDTVKAEGAEIVTDLKTLRANLRDEGIKWRHVTALVRALFASKIKKTKKVADKVSDKVTETINHIK